MIKQFVILLIQLDFRGYLSGKNKITVVESVRYVEIRII